MVSALCGVGIASSTIPSTRTTAPNCMLAFTRLTLRLSRVASPWRTTEPNEGDVGHATSAFLEERHVHSNRSLGSTVLSGDLLSGALFKVVDLLQE